MVSCRIQVPCPCYSRFPYPSQRYIPPTRTAYTCNKILYDITLYHTISHCIIWYHIVLYDITLYYMILHCIIWYHIVLYYITLYYTISYSSIMYNASSERPSFQPELLAQPNLATLTSKRIGTVMFYRPGRACHASFQAGRILYVITALWQKVLICSLESPPFEL